MNDEKLILPELEAVAVKMTSKQQEVLVRLGKEIIFMENLMKNEA